jgi:hypothetical protein
MADLNDKEYVDDLREDRKDQAVKKVYRIKGDMFDFLFPAAFLEDVIIGLDEAYAILGYRIDKAPYDSEYDYAVYPKIGRTPIETFDIREVRLSDYCEIAERTTAYDRMIRGEQ